MFQPGEEGHSGARHMIEEGVLEAAGERPVAAYAIHVNSTGLPPGVYRGPRTAPNNHAPDAVFDDAVLTDGAALLAEPARRRLATAT